MGSLLSNTGVSWFIRHLLVPSAFVLKLLFKIEIRLARASDSEDDNVYFIHGICKDEHQVVMLEPNIVFLVGDYHNNFPGEWGFPSEVFVRKADIGLK